MEPGIWRSFLGIVLASAALPHAGAQDVAEIVRRSVENNERNWTAAPYFQFVEHDIVVKGGHRVDRTYRVTMIEGSPYEETLDINGRPLTEPEKRAEEEKLRRAVNRRKNETPQARAKRISAYEQERRQDHALMREMPRAFEFELAGKERVNGRECFRVEATPKPGYVPPGRDTKALTGMKGTLWIDASEFQWVRVKAAVFRPVAFGLFIAHVEPGTEFTLEEEPVGGGLWMPSHFHTEVKASVLFWSRNSLDDESYSEYRRAEGENGENRSRPD